MTTQDTEKSEFLINQERIMKLRASQDREIEERQKHGLVPAVQEADSRQTDIVETFIPQTGQWSRQVIQPATPSVQRFVKPAPLTLDEIKEQLVAAGNSIDAAKEQYQSNTDSLNAFYAEANALRSEIAELQAALAEKQGRLREIESAGSPKDKFLATIVKAEIEVAGIAKALFTTLSEQASQKIFGIPFGELSSDGKRDVQARFRKALQRFTGGFYVRLGRTVKTATVEQVSARAEQLLTDLESILTDHFDK
jgi:formylmethanofuran dehydrogenase subunit D